MLSKERQAKRRANIKKDNEAYQTYLKKKDRQRKDRQRKAAQRSAARVALTTAEVEEYRLKEDNISGTIVPKKNHKLKKERKASH